MRQPSLETRATTRFISTYLGAHSRWVRSTRLSRTSLLLSNSTQVKPTPSTSKEGATCLLTTIRRLLSSFKKQLSNIQEKLPTGPHSLLSTTKMEITATLLRTSSKLPHSILLSLRSGTTWVFFMRSANNQRRHSSLTAKFKTLSKEKRTP